MMGFFRKLWQSFKREEQTETLQNEVPQKSFFLYIAEITKVLTYFRREKGISKKDLEQIGRAHV